MYSVPQYLRMLKAARRSENTIKDYEFELRKFARFLDVPIEDLHNHLLPQNLIDYSESFSGKQSSKTTRKQLAVLSRYYKVNGVRFDDLQMAVIRSTSIDEDHDDKPLTLETLQKMMDLGNLHAKAIISALVSTGMRREECAGLKLSDVNGDTVSVFGKGRRRRTAYLTKEAQEYIELWLRERDAYIRRARTKHLAVKYGRNPDADSRLFACTGGTIEWIWSNLYNKVDGERGKYHAKCTLHSCRRYFRTHAVKGMDLDLVEKIMGHQGYLTKSYVRIEEEDARRQFHDGEHFLYITRKDQRYSDTVIERMQRDLEKTQEELKVVQTYVNEAKKRSA